MTAAMMTAQMAGDMGYSCPAMAGSRVRLACDELIKVWVLDPRCTLPTVVEHFVSDLYGGCTPTPLDRRHIAPLSRNSLRAGQTVIRLWARQWTCGASGGDVELCR